MGRSRRRNEFQKRKLWRCRKCKDEVRKVNAQEQCGSCGYNAKKDGPLKVVV